MASAPLGSHNTVEFTASLPFSQHSLTDVLTTMKDRVPFFYFSGEDFYIGQTFWPLGILEVNGHPKPLREDLPMGARALEMACSSGKVRVVDQEQLLAKLYGGCMLPANDVSVLES